MIALARQMILVRTNDWASVTGRLLRFERAVSGADWKPVGEETAIVVGRSGLAWGRGVHSNPPDAGPIKHEGDGKAPAGVFRLSSAFGYAPRDAAGFIRLPYIQSTTSIECVDDVDSTQYNRLVDRSRAATIDWKSSEQMLRQDEQYRWGVVVDHNANSPVTGGGSCIFLHIWRGASSGTSGCTAMEQSHLEELLRWLDPAASPILVQLPNAQFLKLREPWGLPSSEKR
jgi:D-alanyl-D-alanine dipeptidase